MRRLIPALSLLLTALLAPACATTPKAPAAEATTPGLTEQAFLWEVKDGRGQGGTVYVVGSIHLGKEGQLTLPPSMGAAFERSDVLVVEVDVTQVDQARMQQLVLAHGMLPPEQPLSSRLDVETRTLLTEAAARVGLPMLGLERMRPWLAAMTLSMLELRRVGFEPGNGVDLAFLRRARQGRKEVLELETAEGQVRMLATLPEPIQDLMLRDQLLSSFRSPQLIDLLVEDWKAGDGEAMAIHVLEGATKPEYLPLYEKIFFERNEQMARRIGEMLAQPRTHFVVVGAGHVVGARGILALLQAKGHTVRQLPKAP